MQAPRFGSRFWLTLLLLITFTLGACERKPEDLEQWRNAQGGKEKMAEWAKSKKEPMPVRERALQILIEEQENSQIVAILDGVKDETARAQLAASIVPTIQEMWKAQDFPKMDPKAEAANGAIQVKVEGPMKAVAAVEAAYYTHPYVSGAEQKALEDIMGEWLSADHKLRTQLSNRITLYQILPRAGDKGFDGMMKWFAEAKKTGTLAREIRAHADDKTKDRFAKVVLERADKDHPNIDPELSVVILETESKVILPYLERAVEDPESDPAHADACMDAYIRIKGPTATTFLNKLVKNTTGLMRWVAVTRLIELRGKDGVTQAVNALPLETEKYAQSGKSTLEGDSKYFCNIVKSELEKKDIKDIKPIITGLLEMNRWPAQLLGVRCVELNKWADLKPKVEALAESEQVIPGWGEEGTTLGTIAKGVAEGLGQ